MSLQKKITKRKNRRAQHVRSKVRSKNICRVSIFRSLNHIYAQIIDDVQQRTLASSSTLASKHQGDKKEEARSIGKELAKKALQQGIEKVAFDRGPYLYHGRVKALAEGLREGGLKL